MNEVKKLVTSQNFSPLAKEINDNGFFGMQHLEKCKDDLYIGVYICEDSKISLEVVLMDSETTKGEIEAWLCLDTYETGISIHGGDSDFFYNNTQEICFKKILNATYEVLNNTVVSNTDIAPKGRKYNGNEISRFINTATKIFELTKEFNSKTIKQAA